MTVSGSQQPPRAQISQEKRSDPTSVERCIAICSALGLTVLGVGSVYMMQPLFATISIHFAVSESAARYAFAWPLVAYALAFFAVGPLTDRVPPLAMAGVGGFCLGGLLLLAASVANYTIFVAVLTLAGAVAAIIPAATFSFMGRVAPAARLGIYFGMAIAASVSGITIGRTLGAIIVDQYSLNTLLLTMATSVSLASGFAIYFRKVSASPPGATLSICDVYRSGLGILRKILIARYLLGGFLLFFGYIGVLTFLTFRLQQAPFNYTLAQIGWISSFGLIAIIGAPGAGVVIRHLGARRSAVVSLIIVLVAIVALWLSTVFFEVAAGLLLLFLGVFAFQPTILVLLSSAVPPVSRGSASSMYLLVCLGGGGISSIVLGGTWTAYGWSGICAVASLSVVLSLLIFSLTSVKTT